MKHLNMKTTKTLLIFGACLGMVGSSWAAELWLRAAATTINLPGRDTPVTMWGFAQDSNGTANDGTVTVPGPQITVAPGDNTLIINLKNTLPEPVSIVIPGQNGFVLDAVHSTFVDGQGRIRAKSFVKETAPGAVVTYTWNNLTAGTYLYHSGSHAAVQVQMGLYGALVKDFSMDPASRAYQGVGYDNAVTLLFSEVDVNVHDAVGAGIYWLPGDVDNEPLGWATGGAMSPGDVDVNGNTLYDAADGDVDNLPSGWAGGGAMSPGDVDHNGNMIFDTSMRSTGDSRPQYFLINGKAYTPGQTPIYLPGGQGQRALFRFLNAGLDSHIPILTGISDLLLVAEDGRKYPDRKSVYSVHLPSLKTTDALVNNMGYGMYAVYDRRLGLANGAAGSGGMLAYVSVPFSQANINSITINASGNASPYGSGNALFTVPGGNSFPIGKVTVTLNNFYHARPQDVDVMLVHTAGGVSQKVMLMSDVGGLTAIPSTAPVTLTFDQAASGSLSSAALVTGTYLPTNIGDGQGTDNFAGVPAGPIQSSLDAFNGINSGGQWRLYIRDDTAGNAGAVAGGWSLTLYPTWNP